MNKAGKAEQHLYRSHDDTGKTPTLAEVGITHSMSSRAQKIARVAEAEFEAVLIVSQNVQVLRVQYRTARAVAAESSL